MHTLCYMDMSNVRLAQELKLNRIILMFKISFRGEEEQNPYRKVAAGNTWVRHTGTKHLLAAGFEASGKSY